MPEFGSINLKITNISLSWVKCSWLPNKNEKKKKKEKTKVPKLYFVKFFPSGYNWGLGRQRIQDKYETKTSCVFILCVPCISTFCEYVCVGTHFCSFRISLPINIRTKKTIYKHFGSLCMREWKVLIKNPHTFSHELVSCRCLQLFN